jgi:hypothetical protein
MERGMLLAPLLLLFGAITPSVNARMVRFELSVAIATSAPETSQGRLAVHPYVLVVVRAQGPVDIYFDDDDDDAKWRHTEHSQTSAKVPVTRKMDKGSEVTGPSDDGHFTLNCLTLVILEPNS